MIPHTRFVQNINTEGLIKNLHISQHVIYQKRRKYLCNNIFVSVE